MMLFIGHFKNNLIENLQHEQVYNDEIGFLKSTQQVLKLKMKTDSKYYMIMKFQFSEVILQPVLPHVCCYSEMVNQESQDNTYKVVMVIK